MKISPRLQKVSFHTIGCRLNRSETAVIEQLFLDQGFSVADRHDHADVVVINTCTVTAKGDVDTRRLVNKINRTNPRARIALIGCQAQLQSQQLSVLPNVHWIVGNARKMQLAEIIKQPLRTSAAGPVPLIVNPPITEKNFTIPRAGIDAGRTRVNLKIQDGCDNFCSFCTIPYARGHARSRVFSDIIREARDLARAGYQEIVITGINVGTYKYRHYRLPDVISALEHIDTIKRVRLSSIEATTVNEKILRKMLPAGKLCRFLHIPMQHAHDDILTAMNRPCGFDDYQHIIENIHRTVPRICIGTDVIVGFPGERDEHFEALRTRLSSLPVHYFHVFSYSARPLAASASFANPVDIPTIQARSRILRRLSSQKREQYFQSLIGTKQTVIFEQKKAQYWTGLTDHYCRVHAASGTDQRNNIQSVFITHVADNKIFGKIVEQNNQEETI